MKIVELKDALRRLNLSTTGNKTELKMRLQNARVRQQRLQGKDSSDVSDVDDDVAGDEGTASEESTAGDNDSDDENVVSSEEGSKKRKGRGDRERTSIERVSRRNRDGGVARGRLRDRAMTDKVSRHEIDRDAAESRRVRLKKERTLSTDQEETSDASGSESSDSDYSRERTRRRSRHRHGNFSIKDAKRSLTYFSGDDKLSVEKWIAEFEDISALLRWDDLQN